MSDIDYSKFIVSKKGGAYLSPVKWSHYTAPVDQSPGRTAGNSRIWGDASVETQKASIDAIVAAAKARGLSTRETAHVLAIARVESGFNPDAAAGTTSASGLGQFIDKTSKHYNLTSSNRWNAKEQAEALVGHFVDNRNLAAKRGLGEEYIYKFHHDGPTADFGGLKLSTKQILPLIDGYEAALKGSAASQSADTQASAPQAQGLPKKEQNMNMATQGGTYAIGKGDTLSKIAARHGVSAEDLAKANGISDPNRIRAGQTLTIPGQAPQSPSPQEIEGRMLGGKVTPVTGGTATPLPTASQWPQAAPGAGAAPDAPAAPVLEQKPSEPPADPKVTAMVEMSGQPVDNPGKAALLKPVETLTQSEMTDMINSAQGDYRGYRSGNPLKAHTYERVQDWHAAMYGDGPQANDGGKPVDPTPIRAIPIRPIPHVTPQGEDLWQATGRLGGKVAEAAGTDGADNALKSLQRGLNMLNDAKPLPARSAAYAPYTKLGPVAEDGAYGPQTDFALKHATARLGPGKVEEAFALGRFNTFAREAQRSGNAEGLEAKTHAAFGPLFRDPADTKAPKLEGGALQETLNNLGPRGQDDWTPLKVDNWIGPKTTEAFGKILQSEDADGITAALGRGLGFL